MITNFQASVEGTPLPQSTQQETPAPQPRQEVVRIAVTGSPKAVKAIVVDLHSRRFAEANDWSPPVPTGRAGEVVSVLLKRIWLN